MIWNFLKVENKERDIKKIIIKKGKVIWMNKKIKICCFISLNVS